MPSAKLALFCYPVASAEGDPSNIKKRLILIYGEGYYTAGNLPVSFSRVEKRGIHIFRWAGDYDKISRYLQAECIDDEARGIRLKAGLLLRPPILAAREHLLPFPSNSLVHQYACLDKRSLLQEIWSGEDEPSKKLTLVDKALDKIGELSGRAFRRGEHHLLGDVFLVDRPRERVLPITWQHEHTEDGGIAVHIDVDPALINASQAVINLRVTGSDSYVIDDRAVFWSRESGTRLTVRFNQPFSGVELKIWVEQRLRWELDYAVQPSMMLNFQNVHGTEHIRDRITERAAKTQRGTKQGKKGTGPVASSIMKYGTGMQSLIGKNENSPWGVAATSARTLPVSLFRPDPPPGTLFR